ncbi:MAG: sigma-70 family RNA polymerase sigma factor [Spirochaetota bacterium]
MQLNSFFKKEYGRLLGILVNYFKDLELAEDSLQEAMLAAIDHSMDTKAREEKEFFQWIVKTAKNKGIDSIRRESRRQSKTLQLVTQQQAFLLEDPLDSMSETTEPYENKLKLLFTCCHRALGEQAQVILTLKCIVGLHVREIASALLMQEEAVAKALTRAKKKIREAGIPFLETSEQMQDPQKLSQVLAILYLIFNEGYLSATHAQRLRTELCEEAMLLASELSLVLKNQSEVFGLLALMGFHHSRRHARFDDKRQLVQLAEQDPKKYDTELIARATSYIQKSFHLQIGGLYQTQAYIAAIHARAIEEEVDWRKISFLYKYLLQDYSTPVLYLNYAVALRKAGELDDAKRVLFARELQAVLEYKYSYYHLARAEFYLEENDLVNARLEYTTALKISKSRQDIEFIKEKLQKLP